MLITVLRDLRVQDETGATIPIPGTRLQHLLVRLAVDAGRPVSTGELFDSIWADPPADPAGALQALVSRLRRTLGVTIEQTGSGYRLLVDPFAVDLHRFEALIERGRSGDHSAYVEGLALLDGPPLPVVADQPWALPLVSRIEQEAVEAEHAVIENRLITGDLTGLAARLRDLVTAHPLDEEFAAQLIRTLRADGQTSEALAAYEQTRRTLADTLGTDPGTVLQDLYADLLRGVPASTPGSALRTGLTSFVGREAELDALSADLAEHRLVTVLGPGGAGKTRLATEAGIAWRDEHDAPVWLVELAPVSEPAAVLPTFVAALDLQTSRVFERLRAAGRAVDDWALLTGALASGPGLLIVDNCEHLLDDAAAIIERLLVSAPQTRVIATSREPLAIDGEHVLPLPPLRPSPAVQLFLDRAASAGVPVSAAESDSVAEIVRRLDGLPLAIELAAARVRTMPVPVIAERLSDRFALLTGGRRTALPRHRTLYAVVAWSWDLLDEAERDLLQRFSVFSGGADAVSAAVVTGSPDAEVRLASLVDKSLLVVDRQGAAVRYRMLETIREFGLNQLDAAGLAPDVRDAHAVWALDFARTQDARLRGPEQVEALDSLAAEADNLLAALRYLADNHRAQGATDLLLALNWWLFMLDDDQRTVALTRIALDAPGEVTAASRSAVRMLHVAALAATAGTDLESAKEQIRHAAQDVAADPGLIEQWPHLQIVLLQASIWVDVPDLTERLTRTPLVHETPWLRAVALQTEVDIADNAGDQGAVREALAAMAELIEPLDDRWLTAAFLVRRSQVEAQDGDPARALASLEQARQLISTLGRSGDEMYLAIRAMDLQLRLGQYDAARAAIRDIPRQWNEVLGADLPNAFLVNVAVAEGNSERLAEARALLRDPQPVPGAFHDHSQTLLQTSITLLEAEDGDEAAAVRALTKGYPSAVATADMPLLAMYAVAAAFAVSLDRPERAAECLGEAAAIRGIDDPEDPIVAVLATRLRAALGERFDSAYAKGRSKDRADAIADVDPAVLFPTG